MFVCLSVCLSVSLRIENSSPCVSLLFSTRVLRGLDGLRFDVLQSVVSIYLLFQFICFFDILLVELQSSIGCERGAECISLMIGKSVEI